MLFLMYWELNEQFEMKERLQAAEKLMAIPSEGVEIVRFDVTPDYWGVTLIESNTVDDVANFANMWRIACPGIFKKTKISPARPVQESLASTYELMQKLESL